MSWKKNRRFT